MLNLSFQTLIALILSAAACAKEDHVPADSKSPEYDDALAREYQALPETVLIGVRSDGSTNEMRIPASDTLITDDESALVAFESGVEARVSAATSELDRKQYEEGGLGHFVKRIIHLHDLKTQ